MRAAFGRGGDLPLNLPTSLFERQCIETDHLGLLCSLVSSFTPFRYLRRPVFPFVSCAVHAVLLHSRSSRVHGVH
jgi:hypothetical protein